MTAKKGRICSIGLGAFFYFVLLAQTISAYPISAIIRHFMLGPLIMFSVMFLFLNVQLCPQVLYPVIVGLIGLVLLKGKGTYPEISDLDWIVLSLALSVSSI